MRRVRCRVAEGKGCALGERIGHERTLLGGRFLVSSDHDEIHRDEMGPLVQQLVKGVLAGCPRCTPDDGSRGVVDLVPVSVHALPIRFHLELLKIGR